MIQSLLMEHLVLFFPEQYLSVEEHVAFGRHFGKLEGHPNLRNPFSDQPEIFEISASHGGVADEWHSDITFQSQPSILAILNMVTCPEVGGDTMWANMYKAYDSLSAPIRDLYEGLTALHDASPHGKSDSMAVHPVVRVHPVTQRKSLFVNEHFHSAHRRAQSPGKRHIARLSNTLGLKPTFHRPLSLECWHDCDVGQPLHPTLCA